MVTKSRNRCLFRQAAAIPTAWALGMVNNCWQKGAPCSINSQLATSQTGTNDNDAPAQTFRNKFTGGLGNRETNTVYCIYIFMKKTAHLQSNLDLKKWTVLACRI
ncbi:hypothetical protein FKM82_031350 [Ascaphus truei]